MRRALAALVAGIAIGVALNPLVSKAKPPRWWVSDAICVHTGIKNGVRVGSGEGSWSDPNAPYYGGLQMDWGFMRHYGRWILNHHGTADHWRPATQLLVAYRGWKVQGWGAWPNTARACGLL